MFPNRPVSGSWGLSIPKFYIRPRTRQISLRLRTCEPRSAELRANKRSELVSQGQLQGPLRIDGAATGAECAVCYSRVGSCEGMAIERVGEFYLENKHVRFKDRSAFDEGKIFVEIRLTSDCSGYSRQISEQPWTGLAIFGREVLVEKGSAVEIRIGA